ncbi:biotin/lipoate A/B protein ligase family protein [uncultured Bacteroides sp.]|uniref:lipoate--protein ligase family protein n=1 Tax=uncultured Bacteroides sp. TaxID=162156 RepID=UPI002AAB217C|nr:biotin/lipoate A/B protein ligase family protein [uncultured Bacteroides sp.]
MFCINNSHTDACFNLAAEEYLLRSFSENIFMLWQNEPSVIIGKHQNVWAEVNLDFVRDNHIKVVRRYSGGGAVYHDAGNLNFTFIENSSNADFNKYAVQIQHLLKEIGIEAKADERRALTLNGLKISGSAQCIHKNRVMYHATLLFSTNLANLSAALLPHLSQLDNKEANQRPVYVKSVRSPVTNIREYIPGSMQINDLKNVIMNYFMSNKTDNNTYTFNKKDIEAIRQLREEKYSTSDWIFNASYLK